jgi:hypothetical protein
MNYTEYIKMLDLVREFILNEDNDKLTELLTTNAISPMDLVRAGAEMAYEEEEDSSDDKNCCNESSSQPDYSNFMEMMNQQMAGLQNMFGRTEKSEMVGSTTDKPMDNIGSMFSQVFSMFGSMGNQSQTDCTHKCDTGCEESCEHECKKECHEVASESVAAGTVGCSNPNCSCDPCSCDPCNCGKDTTECSKNTGCTEDCHSKCDTECEQC